jgi:hypothetical protein
MAESPSTAASEAAPGSAERSAPRPAAPNPWARGALLVVLAGIAAMVAALIMTGTVFADDLAEVSAGRRAYSFALDQLWNDPATAGWRLWIAVLTVTACGLLVIGTGSSVFALFVSRAGRGVATVALVLGALCLVLLGIGALVLWFGSV